MDPRLFHLVHKPLQAVQIEDALRLDIGGSGIHLLPQLIELQGQRFIYRRYRSALEESGRATG